MTIHIALLYFDEDTESCGYLLAADTCCSNTIDDTVELGEMAESFDVDKSFSGDNFIGLVRGAIQIPTSGSVPERFYEAVSSLDGHFEDIEEGICYSDHPLLSNIEYTLLIAKRNPDSLELYSVSNQRKEDERNHKAALLHRIDRKSFHREEKSQLWYAPCTQDYMVASLTKCDFHKGAGFLPEVVQISLPHCLDYQPGNSILYEVGFERVGKIQS